MAPISNTKTSYDLEQVINFFRLNFLNHDVGLNKSRGSNNIKEGREGRRWMLSLESNDMVSQPALSPLCPLFLQPLLAPLPFPSSQGTDNTQSKSSTYQLQDCWWAWPGDPFTALHGDDIWYLPVWIRITLPMTVFILGKIEYLLLGKPANNPSAVVRLLFNTPLPRLRFIFKLPLLCSTEEEK